MSGAAAVKINRIIVCGISQFVDVGITTKIATTFITSTVIPCYSDAVTHTWGRCLKVLPSNCFAW